jgi:hypothetical protein
MQGAAGTRSGRRRVDPGYGEAKEMGNFWGRPTMVEPARRVPWEQLSTALRHGGLWNIQEDKDVEKIRKKWKRK